MRLNGEWSSEEIPYQQETPSFKLTSTQRRYAVGYSQDEWTIERNWRGYLLNLVNMWDIWICVVAGLHLGDEGGRVSPLDSSERKALCLLRLRDWTSLPRVLNFTRTGSKIKEGKWRIKETLRRALNTFSYSTFWRSRAAHVIIIFRKALQNQEWKVTCEPRDFKMKIGQDVKYGQLSNT